MKRQSLWKKTMALALAAALLVGVSACGNDSGSGGGSAESSGGSAEEAADASGDEQSEQGGQEEKGDDEVITLTVLGSMGGTDGVSTDDPIGQYIKDELGIVLEYTQVSNDRLKVMAAGGDLPDIVMLHEAPEIPNYEVKRKGVRLKAGMTLAIEPMINIGGWEVEWLDDDWTVVTRDRSLSAHYENTVLITEGGPRLLTYGRV